MKRPIVTDPNKFGGAPFVEGTSITIAEVQAYWKQPGVGAAEVRRRFPELSEGELGAAVTHTPRHEPEFSFVAEVEQPRRRLRIASSAQGWMFFVFDVDSAGAEHLSFDTWEDTWDEIVRYPEGHAPKAIVWRDERGGAIVDIYATKPS